MNPVWYFLNGVPTGGVLAPSRVLAFDGTATLPSITFGSQPSIGLYKAATDTLGLAGGKVHFTNEAGGVSITWNQGDARQFTLASNAALAFWSTTTPNGSGDVDVTLSRLAADVLGTPDRFLSTGPGSGIGYGTGAGGTQTQLTSKATTVVLNTITGEITMHNATLNAATAVTFALTNSAIALGDMVLVQHISAGTLGAYVCQGIAGSGTANITVTNRSAGNLGEAIVLKYLVLKAVTA